MAQVIFITGTDTGAGKTLLTALLLTHLRTSGCHALATKPFCSGGRSDAQILARAQHHEINIDRVNPFYFDQPVAPLIAARKAHRRVPLAAVLAHIHSLAAECEWLLVEGAGGLFVPLGEQFTVADLIHALRAPVLVAARNALGVVNHSLLTLDALSRLAVPAARVVLMNTASGSSLAQITNARLIADWTTTSSVVELPYLGRRPAQLRSLQFNAKKFKKTLAQILRFDTFSLAFRKLGGGKVGSKKRKKSACTEFEIG